MSALTRLATDGTLISGTRRMMSGGRIGGRRGQGMENSARTGGCRRQWQSALSGEKVGAWRKGKRSGLENRHPSQDLRVRLPPPPSQLSSKTGRNCNPGYFLPDGRAPAARSASCRSHVDSSSPSLSAASVSARFCSGVTRIRTMSFFVARTGRLAFDIAHQCNHFVAT